MQKIPTLFKRNEADRRFVTDEVNPGCEWVLAGEGVPTRKYDGTCVMFDGERWWARREVKPGKKAPDNYVPVTTDETTGKTMGWEPIEQSPFAKFHAEAVADAADLGGAVFETGTYELVGPRIQGNPEGSPRHHLVPHAYATWLRDTGRTYGDIKAQIMALKDKGVEGIVWHHRDGRMAKLKVRDFDWRD